MPIITRLQHAHEVQFETLAALRGFNHLIRYYDDNDVEVSGWELSCLIGPHLKRLDDVLRFLENATPVPPELFDLTGDYAKMNTE